MTNIMQASPPPLPLSGQYTLRVRDAKSKKIKKEVGPFSNLITDIGLNRIGTSPSVASDCYVGTGTVPPQVTDTTMSTYKVTSNSAGAITYTAGTSPTWICSASRVFTFNSGTISGNITEVGVGWASSPVNALWSRELIVDSNGNPIAITVLPTEILEVVYTLRMHIPQSTFTGSFTLNGVVYNYTAKVRLAGVWRVMNSSMMFGPAIWDAYAAGCALSAGIGGSMTGTIVPSGAVKGPYAYVNNSLTRSGVTNFALTDANTPSGIQGFAIGPSHNNNYNDSFLSMLYQMVLDKPIPKTNLNTMSFTMSISWTRYTP